MKLLFILALANHINDYSLSSRLAAKELGMEFHIASNWEYSGESERRKDESKFGIRIHQIDFRRSPFHPGNLRAYLQLSRIVKNEKIDVIHCNTPTGGVIGRIIGIRFGIDKIIYQAHGFHFYRGAPMKNWVLYYPAEKLLARCTNILVTINKEDYRLAKGKMHVRKEGRIHYIPGIGIDCRKYGHSKVDKTKKLEELGIRANALLILSVGELNRNKNHEVLIRAISNIPDVHYAIAGQGDLLEHLKQVANYVGVSNRVHFLGFREDIDQIYKIADIFCLPSFREGLSASIMEAMASGLPVVCSDIRGNRDLIIQKEGGYLVKPNDVTGYADALCDLLDNPEKRIEMAHFNQNYVHQFGLERVTKMLLSVYEQLLDAG